VTGFKLFFGSRVGWRIGILHFRAQFGETIARIGWFGWHWAASRLENKGFLVFGGAMGGELFPIASIGLPFDSICFALFLPLFPLLKNGSHAKARRRKGSGLGRVDGRYCDGIKLPRSERTAVGGFLPP
jgi:hypothetical protein